MPKQSCRGACFDDYRKHPQKRKVLLVFERIGRENDGEPIWHLPGGKCCTNRGVIQCCLERDYDTAIREVLEETGLYTMVLRFIVRHRVKEVGIDGADTGFTHDRKYFLLKVLGGRLKNHTMVGVKTPAWFPVNGLPRHMHPHHREIIEMALRNEQRYKGGLGMSSSLSPTSQR